MTKRPGTGGTTIHASCIAFGAVGVVLRGASGSGKSDLAFRLIEAGAVLVADDRVELGVEVGRLIAAAPAELAGRLELRGLGLVELPYVSNITVELIADLVSPADIERLPLPGWEDCAGVQIRKVAVAPFEHTAVAKIRIAAYDAVTQPDPVTCARRLVEDEPIR
jgi:HPr kinase/phosphorylase